MNLREAAQQAIDTLCEIKESAQYNSVYAKAIDALRVALAGATIKDNLTVEPVAWITPGQDLHLVNYEGFQDWAPLYTAPPKREPLTDEQIQECVGKVDDARLSGPITEFARAIERAHGIRGDE